MGIVGFDHLDPFNGIEATKREQRVAAPFGPILKTPSGKITSGSCVRNGAHSCPEYGSK
jgi:hypothetical protein